MSQQPKKINLDKKNTLFYLLNVFHDVIHDYGPGSSEDRWFHNQYIIKSFHEGAVTMSVPSTNIEGYVEEDEDSPQKRIKRGGESVVGLKRTQYERDILSRPEEEISPLFAMKGAPLAKGISDRIKFVAKGPRADIINDAKSVSLTSSQVSYIESKNEVDAFLIAIKNDLEFNAFNMIQNIVFERNTNGETSKFPKFDLSTYKSCFKLAYMVIFFPQHNFDVQKQDPEAPENKSFDDGDITINVSGESNRISYDELKNKITDNFALYLFNINQVYSVIYKKSTYSCQEFLNILTNFIDELNIEKSLAEICEVPEDLKILQRYESASESDNEANIMEISGGATDLNAEECRDLVSSITSYISNNMGVIDELRNMISNPERVSILDNYKTKRDIFQNAIKGYLNDKGETKKSGIADNLIKPLQPRYNVRLVDKEIEKFDENFKQQLAKILIDCQKQIKLDDDNKAALELKQLRESEIKEAKQEGAEDLKKLSPDDCKVREQFCSTIAKLGLFLNGVCDSDGNIIRNNLLGNAKLIDPKSLNKVQSKFIKGVNYDGHNDFVKMQTDILLYYAEWNKKNEGFGNVKSMLLDDELYYFIMYQYRSQNIPDSKILCSKCEKYAIDNASKIDAPVREKVFCPYTSILDGMSQCSYKSAIGRMEFGDMYFRVGRDDCYYQGMVTISPQNKQVVSYELTLKPVNNVDTFIIDSPGMLLTGGDLKAFIALKNTLISIINYVEKMQDLTAQGYITSTAPEGKKEGIFGNIFRLLSGSNRLGLQDKNFIGILLNILIKGSGDLFQEINSVCKNGGYISPPEGNKNKIVNYDNAGNAMRLFAANDRPSASRFCFLLINGNDNDINTKAFGGYTGPQKEKDLLIVKGPNPNVKICTFCGKTGGNKKSTRAKRKLHNNLSKKQVKQKNKRKTKKGLNKRKMRKSKKVIQ